MKNKRASCSDDKALRHNTPFKRAIKINGSGFAA
jgi:hypothetical protein